MDSLPFCAVENKLQTLIVYPILATILLILVFQFVENKSCNISVEEYFYQNSDEFADIVDVLRQNKVEGFLLHLTSEGDIQTLFGDANQDVSAEAIRSVFKKTDCNAIYASTTRSGNFYCRFACRGHDAVNGIAFVGDNRYPDTINSIFSGSLVSECTFIDDEWVRFEYYTAEGEKKITG